MHACTSTTCTVLYRTCTHQGMSMTCTVYFNVDFTGHSVYHARCGCASMCGGHIVHIKVRWWYTAHVVDVPGGVCTVYTLYDLHEFVQVNRVHRDAMDYALCPSDRLCTRCTSWTCMDALRCVVYAPPQCALDRSVVVKSDASVHVHDVHCVYYQSPSPAQSM